MATVSKILIADDDSVMLDTLSALLASEGYEIVKAGNGLEAVALAKKELPVLIMLDIHMPELDGLKACRALKDNPVTKAIPVIMLTVDGRINEIRRAIDYGAKTYITKPSSREEILKVVKSILY
jgi:CheY-like chemotaxis protein